MSKAFLMSDYERIWHGYEIVNRRMDRELTY